VGRGGGSLEDLWAFNEEVVARAIFDCTIPVISAVGHEIDVSIADLVADCRALTPTEAGQLVVPHGVEVRRELGRLAERLSQALRTRAACARLSLEGTSCRRCFTRPLDRLHDLATRLDDVDGRLRRVWGASFAQRRERLVAIAGALDALSPLNVLARGYSITMQADGAIVRSFETPAIDEQIVTRLPDGRITSRVESREARAVPHSRDVHNDRRKAAIELRP
jgi:exodeoxyribonuclease VII large subunit